MNILFLDAYFEPEQISFTHLEKDLLSGLVNAGHSVEVICPTPTRGIDRKTANIYKKRMSETIYDGYVHITRFNSPHEGKNPIIRAFRYFWCNIRTYQVGKKAHNIDLVFANSTPPTQGWVSGKVAKKL
ncbi:MAG: glycosyltransferase WbuB, partial [Clostridia bacterium]|nr:glycosyltransferase WbuB [Clostridia bacterium]